MWALQLQFADRGPFFLPSAGHEPGGELEASGAVCPGGEMGHCGCAAARMFGVSAGVAERQSRQVRLGRVWGGTPDKTGAVNEKLGALTL